MSYCNRFKAISRQFRHATRLSTPRTLTATGVRQFTPVLTQTSALPNYLSSLPKQSFACKSLPTAAFSTVTSNATSSTISTEEGDESEESSGKSKGMSKEGDNADGPRTQEKVYDPGIEDKEQPYEFAEEKPEQKGEENSQETAQPDLKDGKEEIPETKGAKEETPASDANEAKEQTTKVKEGMGWWKAFKNTIGRMAEEPESGGGSSRDAERLEAENVRLRQIGANLQDDLVRLRNRTDKEKKEIEKFACEKFAKELLTVQDNFDLAMKNLTPEIKSTLDNKEVLSVLEGVEMTQKTLIKAFEKFDIKKIETVGVADFSCHEVMFTLKMEGKPENEIIEVLRDGYWIGDRVLRAAQVGVVKNT